MRDILSFHLFRIRKIIYCSVHLKQNGLFSKGIRRFFFSEKFGYSDDCSGTPRWGTNFSEISFSCDRLIQNCCYHASIVHELDLGNMGVQKSYIGRYIEFLIVGDYPSLTSGRHQICTYVCVDSLLCRVCYAKDYFVCSGQYPQWKNYNHA